MYLNQRRQITAIDSQSVLFIARLRVSLNYLISFTRHDSLPVEI